MRIVAGEFSSRRLETRKGNDTRPTLDKVREAVFSSLGGMFDGGIVLDLYAGSGAIGLEALSRGMEHAVFVDSAHDAIQVIRKNVATLKVNDRSRILAMRDVKALEVLNEEKMQFDLIYLDPPYAFQHNEEIMDYLVKENMIHSGGHVVIESLKEEIFNKDYPTVHPYKTKEYGISRITYYISD